jgi:hypothetical protein
VRDGLQLGGLSARTWLWVNWNLLAPTIVDGMSVLKNVGCESMWVVVLVGKEDCRTRFVGRETMSVWKDIAEREYLSGVNNVVRKTLSIPNRQYCLTYLATAYTKNQSHKRV